MEYLTYVRKYMVLMCSKKIATAYYDPSYQFTQVGSAEALFVPPFPGTTFNYSVWFKASRIQLHFSVSNLNFINPDWIPESSNSLDNKYEVFEKIAITGMGTYMPIF